MIDIEQLESLGWDSRLIDEVNRVAQALNRELQGMPKLPMAEIVSQSGSMLHIDPSALPNAACQLRTDGTPK